MKKFSKVILIVAAIFIVFGAGLTILAGMNGVWPAELVFPSGISGAQLWRSVTEWGERDYAKGVVNQDGSRVQTLRLQVGAGDVTIKEGEDFAVNYGGKVRNIQVLQNNGELSIRLNDRFHLTDWNSSGKFSKNGRLTLIIPKDYLFQDVVIQQNAGRLTIDGLQIINSASISLDAGVLELKGLQAEDADLNLGSGTVKISDYLATTGLVNCGCGSIILSCAASEAEIQGQVQVELGTVTINGHRQNGTVDAGFGYALAPHELNIKCDVGVIHLCTAETL